MATMRRSTYCDRCHLEIDSRPVEFLQSMGLLAWVSFHPIRGYYCRRCTGILFWKVAATNLTLGLLWWLGAFAGPLLTFANKCHNHIKTIPMDFSRSDREMGTTTEKPLVPRSR